MSIEGAYVIPPTYPRDKWERTVQLELVKRVLESFNTDTTEYVALVEEKNKNRFDVPFTFVVSERNKSFSFKNMFKEKSLWGTVYLYENEDYFGVWFDLPEQYGMFATSGTIRNLPNIPWDRVTNWRDK